MSVNLLTFAHTNNDNDNRKRKPTEENEGMNGVSTPRSNDSASTVPSKSSDLTLWFKVIVSPSRNSEMNDVQKYSVP
jgi:hypothetical protein